MTDCDADALRVLTVSQASLNGARPVREVPRGDALVFEVQVLRSPVAGAPPAPVNVTGWSFWCTLKNYVDDPDNRAVAQVTDSSGIALTLPLAGRVRVTIPGTATRLFPDGPVRLAYDVRVRDASSLVFTVEQGTVVVTPHATRAPTA